MGSSVLGPLDPSQLGKRIATQMFGSAEPKGSVYDNSNPENFKCPMTGANLVWLTSRYEEIKSSRRSNKHVKAQAQIIKEFNDFVNNLTDESAALTLEQLEELSQKILLRRTASSLFDPLAAANLIVNALAEQIRKSAEYYYYLPVDKDQQDKVHERYQAIMVNLDRFPDKTKPLTVGDLRLYFRILKQYEKEAGHTYRQSLQDLYQFITFQYGLTDNRKQEDSHELSLDDMHMLSHVMASRRQRNSRTTRDANSFESRFFNYLSEHSRAHLKHIFARDVQKERNNESKVDTRKYQATHTQLFEFPDTTKYLTLRDLLIYFDYYREHRGFFRRNFSIIGLSAAMTEYEALIKKIAAEHGIKNLDTANSQADDEKLDVKLTVAQLTNIANYLNNCREKYRIDTPAERKKATAKTLGFLAQHVQHSLKKYPMAATLRAATITAATGLPDKSQPLTVRDLKLYLQRLESIQVKSTFSKNDSTYIQQLKQIIQILILQAKDGDYVLESNDKATLKEVLRIRKSGDTSIPLLPSVETIAELVNKYQQRTSSKADPYAQTVMSHLLEHSYAYERHIQLQDVNQLLQFTPPQQGVAIVTKADHEHYYMVLPDMTLNVFHRQAFHDVVVNQGKLAPALLVPYVDNQFNPIKLNAIESVDEKARAIVKNNLADKFSSVEELNITLADYKAAYRGYLCSEQVYPRAYFEDEWSNGDGAGLDLDPKEVLILSYNILKAALPRDVVKKATIAADNISYATSGLSHKNPDDYYLEYFVEQANNELVSQGLDEKCINMDIVLADIDRCYRMFLDNAWDRHKQEQDKAAYDRVAQLAMGIYCRRNNTQHNQNVQQLFDTEWQKAFQETARCPEQTRYRQTVSLFVRAILPTVKENDVDKQLDRVLLEQYQQPLLTQALHNNDYSMLQDTGLDIQTFREIFSQEKAKLTPQQQADVQVMNTLAYTVYRQHKDQYQQKILKQKTAEKREELKQQLRAQGALDEVNIYTDQLPDLCSRVIKQLENNHEITADIFAQAQQLANKQLSSQTADIAYVECLIKHINALRNQQVETRRFGPPEPFCLETQLYLAYVARRAELRADNQVDEFYTAEDNPVYSFAYCVPCKQMVKGHFPTEFDGLRVSSMNHLYKFPLTADIRSVFEGVEQHPHKDYKYITFDISAPQVAPLPRHGNGS